MVNKKARKPKGYAACGLVSGDEERSLLWRRFSKFDNSDTLGLSRLQAAIQIGDAQA